MVAKKDQRMRRVADGVYRRGGVLWVSVYDPQSRKKLWFSGKKEGFGSVADAKAFKAKREDLKHVRGSGKETCDQFAARWVSDFPRAEATTNLHNAERVRKFAKDFKGVAMSKLSREDAYKWAAANRASAQPVRAMFNDAMRVGVIVDNPFANMRLPELRGRRDILVVTEAELVELRQIAYAKHGDYGPVFGAFIFVAAYTGMRPGELYGLRWSDVDFEKDEVQVRRQFRTKTGETTLPKSKRRRTVPLLPQARAALKQVPVRDGVDGVWFTKRGRPFSQRVHHMYWDPVRTAFWYGLPEDRKEEIPLDFDFYELRHFFGSYLAGLDFSPYDIALFMGHEDGGKLAMERYIHTREDDALERAKERFREHTVSGESAAG